MKKLLPILLALFLAVLPVNAVPEFNKYVAVISSEDLVGAFTSAPKYKTDKLIVLNNWRALPAVLDAIATSSGNGPLFIDFLVHGAPQGLFVHRPNGVWHRTTFGYVVNELQERFRGRDLTISFESCDAGYAYKNTIRNNVPIASLQTITDISYDYPNVPPFPIYCANLNWDGIGPMCYVEERYHFYKYWFDLTKYDPKGENLDLPPIEENQDNGLQQDTQNELMILEMFFYYIP